MWWISSLPRSWWARSLPLVRHGLFDLVSNRYRRQLERYNERHSERRMWRWRRLPKVKSNFESLRKTPTLGILSKRYHCLEITPSNFRFLTFQELLRFAIFRSAIFRGFCLDGSIRFGQRCGSSVDETPRGIAQTGTPFLGPIFCSAFLHCLGQSLHSLKMQVQVVFSPTNTILMFHYVIITFILCGPPTTSV